VSLPLPLPSASPAPGRAPLRSIPAEGEERRAAVPRLELSAYDLGQALALERELGVSHVLAQVLVRRGLSDPVAARAFLDARESHPPGAFGGIERVVQTISRHLAAGSRIVIHGDYDVDGVCATAIMVRALRSLGAEPGWFLPQRLRDGYGLQHATVQRLAARGAGLLITVDCGITAVEEVQAAIEMGIEVIVTDHHAPRADGRRPPCAVLHPGLCGYPCPDLCGAAVAFKLASALGAPTAPEDLELVALATVADLVALRGENRRLVRDGLRQLAATGKPGLRALMRASRTDPGSLDAGAIGFRLAPRINAAGRVGSAEAGLELLLCAERARAEEIAAELEQANARRRLIEERIGWEAEAQVRELGERPAYVLDGAGWHPGVIGIVASRIAERHHRPAILLARDEHDPCRSAQGSGRSIPGFDLLSALRAADELMIRYGGHRAAAGLTIAPERIGALRERIEAVAGELLTPELLESVERVDAVAGGGELGLGLAEELASLEPHGIGNPRPRILVAGARFGDVRPLGDGSHARFTVSSGGARARAVAFRCGGAPAEEPDAPQDATFHLERNFWNGAVEPQLRLRHARRCRPAPIEVLGEPAEYLPAVLAALDAPGEEAEDGAPGGEVGDGAPGGEVGDGAPGRDTGNGSPGDGAGTCAPGPGRTVLDRRGQSALAVLADACAAGRTLAVCADVPRRLDGLAERTGGFALICAHALVLAPQLPDAFEQLVVLDPPSSAELAALLQRAGSGFTQLAWGAAELRFTANMHELEYRLRDSLIALYRELRLCRSASGRELERLLRGDGQFPRPPRLAARLLRVLCELGLARHDRVAGRVDLVDGAAPTELERSASYRYCRRRYEEGRRFLSDASAPAI
jgi:single-stranded-DNA-specific exonuclease